MLDICWIGASNPFQSTDEVESGTVSPFFSIDAFLSVTLA